MDSTAGQSMKGLIAIVVLFCSTPVVAQEVRMSPNVQSGFTVVGISARTNNAVEATSSGKIGPMWGRFLSENLAAAIPARLDHKVVAVLTDYASDEKGDYTYILGVRVSSAVGVPEGMVARVVPSGRYALVVSEEGPPSQVVPEVWRRIWAMTPDALGGRRAFATDFEEYDEADLAKSSLRARIHLSIK
jgi:predicted transcriptional regulator YdeE